MLDRIFTSFATFDHTSLFYIFLTIITYLVAQYLYSKTHNFPLFHPIVGSGAMIIVYLKLTHTDVAEYTSGAHFISDLLAPAIVGLAVPVYGQLRVIRGRLIPIVVSILAGSVTTIVVGFGIGYLFGFGPELLKPMLVKAATTPIAIAAGDMYDASAIAIIVYTLVCGMSSIFTIYLFRFFRIRDHRSMGLALGTCSHAFGTANAFSISPQAGAFSSLALATNGIMIAIVVPLIASFIF